MTWETGADWRTATASRYRGWHLLSLGGALSGAFAGGALQLPLLLLLGLDPGMAWLVSLIPSLGAAAQPLFPRLLDLVGGRLRRLTIIAYAIAETRGLPIGVLVALNGAGLLATGPALVAIAALGALAGIIGQFSGTGQRIWTWVILPEQERRLVAPRLATMAAGASAGLLWLASAALGAGQATGLWIYAACFAVGGGAALIGLRGLWILPRPGSVHSPARRSSAAGTTAAVRNLLAASTLAATGAGLQPAIPLVALAVVHLPPAFTVTLGALGSTTALAASLVGASLVSGLSASRLLRSTHLARLGELILIVVAIGSPGLAGLALLLAALLEAGTSSINGIASSETLYRVSGPTIIADQGRFSAATQSAFTIASLVAALTVTADAGPLTFVLLLGASAGCRLAAARLLRVSASWHEQVTAPVPSVRSR